jgi:TolB-like protein/Tfp pilus assembly protein PilF
MIYKGDNFSLDTQAYVFERAGQNFPIEPQVFDLLVYLIENRERVVSRNELLDNLWRGRIVTDNALNSRLKIARRAVGDNGKQQKIIKTIHRRGYQFVGDIGLLQRQQQDILTTTPGFAAAGDKPSIAILPFEFQGEDTGSDYLADGLTEETIASLCRYRELFVICAESAFASREAGFDSQDMARALGVDYLVKGSIRQSGAHIRVSAQLIAAASGKAIWAERFERFREDIFQLEDELAARIASSLVDHIEDEMFKRSARKRTEDMSAYDCVMRARKGVQSFDQAENAAARELLEQAINRDSECSTAHALMACSFFTEADAPWGLSRTEALASGFPHGRQAVDLDPFSSEAHAWLGWIYLYQKKFELAEQHANQAISCNQNDYEAYCLKSWLLALSGRTAEVSSCVTTAVRHNPLAPDNCLQAQMLAAYIDGRYQHALDTHGLIRQPSAESEVLRAACLAQLKRGREARRAAVRALELGGDHLRQADWIDAWFFRNPQDLQHFLDGMYKAGVLRDPASQAAKPSIAVLGFSDLSGDPAQAYFAYGMTQNIASRLSRIRSLLVKSAIDYASGKQSLPEISRDLGVGYLLGGSVQREGDRVRVFVELTDGGSGQIKWSEHFDRHGKQVIDIQDDIASAIVATLWNKRGAIHEAERDKLATKPTTDFNAFDYILKGMSLKEKFSFEGLVQAHECFDRAIELDPSSAEAYGWRAWIYLLEIQLGSTTDSAESLRQAFVAARQSLDRGSYSEIGHWALGEAFLLQSDYHRGLAEIEKALQINPNDPDLLVTRGYVLCLLGQFDEGIRLIQRGIDFNRQSPQWYFWNLGIAYFTGHRWQDAIAALSRMENQNKDTLIFLAASYALTGDLAAADRQLTELLAIDPAVNLDDIESTHAHLPADSLRFLLDGVRLVLEKSRTPEKLRIV